MTSVFQIRLLFKKKTFWREGRGGWDWGNHGSINIYYVASIMHAWPLMFTSVQRCNCCRGCQVEEETGGARGSLCAFNIIMHISNNNNALC